jgi:hypothetical protein
MADPRSTSLRALRNLSRQYPSTLSATSAHARRRLHITGAYSAQPFNGSNKASLWASLTLADLKQECEKRALGSSGSKNELVERLSNHDMLQSRAFSIAMKRIDGPVFSSASARQFNTSRAKRTVNDSSTMDFVYMPNHSTFEGTNPNPTPRVPILPNAQSGYESSPIVEQAPMKPQIHTVHDMNSDVSVSAMSEVVDNHSISIDPFELTQTVEAARDAELKLKNASQDPEMGIIKEVWTGFLDDLLGPKSKPAAYH